MRNRIFIIAAFVCSLLRVGTLARADIAVAPIFGDHMVLQREVPVPIWGNAVAGTKVTVAFAGKAASAIAGQDGQWRVLIGPLPADATPQEMVVTSSDAGDKPVRIEDILVGEVWLGSGQSNMQGPASMFLPGLKSGDQVLAKSPGDPNLRALIDAAPYPEIRINGVSTNPKTPVPPVWLAATAEHLTQFSAQLQVFGILLHKKLNVPVGLMLAAIGGTPSGEWLTKDALANDPACQAALKVSQQDEQAKYDQALKKYSSDLAAWEQLPADQKQHKRGPVAPSAPLSAGDPTQARWHIGELHDRVLGPYIGFAVRGVLWDQGESGVGIVGLDQYTAMGALIHSWRSEWRQGDFPFIIVQKPSGGGCAFDYQDSKMVWASESFAPLPAVVPNSGESREAYNRIATYPDTFIAQTSDLGTNTHPWNKYGYGSRDLQVALGAVYGRPVEISGPSFASAEAQGDTIRIHFNHVGKGLCFRNGEKLQGFAIAGAERKFAWAEAWIDGDTVVLSNKAVAIPKFARYAWADKHPWANLFNLDGLPAVEFRTDTP
jgi:sialate O-acetylesterase